MSSTPASFVFSSHVLPPMQVTMIPYSLKDGVILHSSVGGVLCLIIKKRILMRNIMSDNPVAIGKLTEEQFTDIMDGSLSSRGRILKLTDDDVAWAHRKNLSIGVFGEPSKLDTSASATVSTLTSTPISTVTSTPVSSLNPPLEREAATEMQISVPTTAPVLSDDQAEVKRVLDVMLQYQLDLYPKMSQQDYFATMKRAITDYMKVQFKE